MVQDMHFVGEVYSVRQDVRGNGQETQFTVNFSLSQHIFEGMVQELQFGCLFERMVQEIQSTSELHFQVKLF